MHWKRYNLSKRNFLYHLILVCKIILPYTKYWSAWLPWYMLQSTMHAGFVMLFTCGYRRDVMNGWYLTYGPFIFPCKENGTSTKTSLLSEGSLLFLIVALATHAWFFLIVPQTSVLFFNNSSAVNTLL